VVFVKVCGVTCVEDAELAVRCGADAVGVNLIATSRRVVDAKLAAGIARAVAGRAVVVAVVADLSATQLREIRSRVGADLCQLHGSEPPEVVAEIEWAYQALRIGSPEDVAVARRYGGDRILVDAGVPGKLGGTGRVFEWTWVRELAAERRLMLAGGLTPENVARAIEVVRPWGVDVASGVEDPGDPRRKDPARLQRFVEAARIAG
jgi:phosphoribosylanthranilate isomerase